MIVNEEGSPNYVAAHADESPAALPMASSALDGFALLVDFARALHVTTDALLGLKPIADTLAPKTARLLKRLQRIEELPAADQRAVLKLVDAMLDTRRRATPPRIKKRKVS